MGTRTCGHEIVCSLQTEAQNPGLQKLLFGAFGLSFGLALIVVCGGDLYTANTSFLSAAVFEASRMLLL